MQVEGSCHCGKIRFEADIDAETVGICHCTDCQTLSASAFRVTAPASEAGFRLLKGMPKLHVKETADSGAPRVQAFCADCGSAIYSTSLAGTERTFGVRIGVLKQRAKLTPSHQVWCQSKLPWLPEMPGEAFEQE
ncbi:aldehyde-activating protein [Labrys miyagiensis]|uniref:Aldehyde-activating protein n=1 Tax=Labrys miyagiensis TaxID=346912 RepID=A0ABQ6CSM0_9HYPH|nr:GFA family protein [Labrys miyagiensis]GLS21970.1 aldehyde-activating protein [Labrys miyagiensis]